MKKIAFRTAGLWVVLALFISSCTKAPKNIGLKKIENFYTTANINGSEVTFTESKDGFVNGYGKGGVYVPTLGKYFERQSTTYAKNGENKFNIYFMNYTLGNPPIEQEVKALFFEGNYGFGNSAPGFFKPGVEIKYIDNNGIEWTTQGDQTGSYFEVTSHAKNTTDSYTPYKTSGKFSCKLHNGLGESITVTDGEFNGRTVVYY
jgi:hypothetical protein